jgi:hypothetical protein
MDFFDRFQDHTVALSSAIMNCPEYAAWVLRQGMEQTTILDHMPNETEDSIVHVQHVIDADIVIAPGSPKQTQEFAMRHYERFDVCGVVHGNTLQECVQCVRAYCDLPIKMMMLMPGVAVSRLDVIQALHKNGLLERRDFWGLEGFHSIEELHTLCALQREQHDGSVVRRWFWWMHTAAPFSLAQRKETITHDLVIDPTQMEEVDLTETLAPMEMYHATRSCMVMLNALPVIQNDHPHDTDDEGHG